MKKHITLRALPIFTPARIGRAFLLLALLSSLVGMKPAGVNAAGASDAQAAGDSPSMNPGVLSGLSPTFASEQAVCPSGMLSYWKLDETTGQVFSDVTGSLNASCSAGNCPAFASGRIGGALDFDGANHRLEVPDDASLDWAGNASFSLELWANFTDVSSQDRVMIGREEQGGTHWWLGAAQDSGYASFTLLDANQAGVSLTGSTPLNDGQWHHLVAVRDDSLDENRLYVDSQLVDAQAHDYTAGFEAATA